MKKAILLILFLSLLLIVGCQSEPSSPYTYQPPENISDGLDVSTLEEVNIDSELMEKVVNEINRKGVWNEKQIISEQWVNKSATSFQRNTGYSYSWWTKSFSDSGKEINMFYAAGWGGQFIMVTPELNTVIVLTGGNYHDKVRIFNILTNYVIPALN